MCVAGCLLTYRSMQVLQDDRGHLPPRGGVDVVVVVRRPPRPVGGVKGDELLGLSDRNVGSSARRCQQPGGRGSEAADRRAATRPSCRRLRCSRVAPAPDSGHWASRPNRHNPLLVEAIHGCPRLVDRIARIPRLARFEPPELGIVVPDSFGFIALHRIDAHRLKLLDLHLDDPLVLGGGSLVVMVSPSDCPSFW